MVIEDQHCDNQMSALYIDNEKETPRRREVTPHDGVRRCFVETLRFL